MDTSAWSLMGLFLIVLGALAWPLGKFGPAKGERS